MWWWPSPLPCDDGTSMWWLYGSVLLLHCFLQAIPAARQAHVLGDHTSPTGVSTSWSDCEPPRVSSHDDMSPLSDTLCPWCRCRESPVSVTGWHCHTVYPHNPWMSSTPTLSRGPGRLKWRRQQWLLLQLPETSVLLLLLAVSRALYQGNVHPMLI